MNILAVLCVRNEGAFVLDWLAHTFASGVSHVLAFSNDCEDGTDAILDRLDQMGHVTHIRNDGPYDNGGIQFTAMKLADKTKQVKKADWILPIDIDEFINVNVGERTLADLIAALPDATAIPLTWRLFGNGGVVRYVDKPVTEQFTRAAPLDIRWPWRSAMFKTLYQNDGTYRNLGIHRPRNPRNGKLKKARWFDGEGRELDEQFKTRRIFSNYGQSNHKLAQLNHYPLGAMESYVLKAARGRAVHSDHLLGLDYWVERNFNVEEDVSIQQLAAKTATIRQDLSSDKKLGELHADAVAWRHSQFDTLMLKEPYRALMGRLLMTPPTQPLSANASRFLTQYANRARRENQKS